MDPDFWDCVKREKLHLIAEFHKMDLEIRGHSEIKTLKPIDMMVFQNFDFDLTNLQL